MRTQTSWACSTAASEFTGTQEPGDLQRVRFVHILAISSITDSDEDGVFEQASATLIWSKEQAQLWSAFGPREDAKCRNLIRTVE